MIQYIFKIILNTFPRTWLISASTVFSKILDLLLRGDSYTDPINNKSYRTFLPYGYQNIRKNVLSPGTLSLERHRLFWLFLKNETDFFTKKIKVLHMAPEQCFYKTIDRLPNVDYVSADLFSPIAKVKADITNLPFDDNSFDVIFCNHVLEHIPDDKTAMSELYRVMKRGGWGVLQIPIDESKEKTYENPKIISKKERKEHFGQYDHVRIYGQDFYDRLSSVGFTTLAFDMFEKIELKDFDRYRISKNEKIPVIKK